MTKTCELESSAVAPARTIPIETTTAVTLIDTARVMMAINWVRAIARRRARRCRGATKPIWLNPANGITPSCPNPDVVQRRTPDSLRTTPCGIVNH